MAIPTRNTTITGVFAEDATTTIPVNPVAGTSYRDANMTESDIKKGFPFKTIVDSSQFNQALYEYSTIAKMQEVYGFVPWSSLTDYVQGSICLGTDGVLYQASQATGPSSTPYNPVSDTSHTYWFPLPFDGGFVLGDLKTSLQTANHGNWFLCNGQAISRTTYNELFDLIGTTYGAGDGSTTFNLPDFTDIIQTTSSSVAIAGNGKAIGWDNGTEQFGTGTFYGEVGTMSTALYGADIGTVEPRNVARVAAIGLTSDATKSGIVGSIQNIKLNYFIKVK